MGQLRHANSMNAVIQSHQQDAEQTNLNDSIDNEYFQHSIPYGGQFEMEGQSLMGFSNNGAHQNPHTNFHSQSMVDQYNNYQRLQQMNLHAGHLH